jgi:hypothetical protein
MNACAVAKFLAIPAAVLVASSTLAAPPLADNLETVARMGPVTKAKCGADDRTEGGLQGETTRQERLSGDSEKGYNCNLELVGQFRGEGTKSQGALAWSEHCAYYTTTNNPLQEHRGTIVLDVSDPAHPRVSTYLDAPAMLDPHESMKLNDRRKLLAGGQYNGPWFAIYDVSGDCSHPVLKSSIQLPGSAAHMSAWAPDGITYYLTQNPQMGAGPLYILDVSDPTNVKQLPTWHFRGDGKPHDADVNADGTRLYSGQFGDVGSLSDGLVILDVSDYQYRRPDPQIRIVSKLFWTDSSGAEQMLPFSANGRRYILSTDEFGGFGAAGGLAAACDREASPFGVPQIIDITDERNPRIIAKVMLEVSAPENCRAFLANPPDLGSAIPGPYPDGYSAERCNLDRTDNPTMLACSFEQAGLRIFDIRDLYHPREIAYWKPSALRKALLPGSFTWSPGADRTADRTAGTPRFVKVGDELNLWTVSDGNGFQVLRFSANFKSQYKDVLGEALRNQPHD